MPRTDPRSRGASSPIASARLAAGLTQEQLGEKMGLPQNVISRWERGACIPKSDFQACQRFGLLHGKPDEIKNGPGISPRPRLINGSQWQCATALQYFARFSG